jgi:hypothetical protein
VERFQRSAWKVIGKGPSGAEPLSFRVAFYFDGYLFAISLKNPSFSSS